MRMNCAYDELYVSCAQRVLGDMYDYAVNTLGYSLEKIHDLFLVSGYAHQFGIGNPTYVAGMNGCELAKKVIAKCTLIEVEKEDIMYVDKSPEYWTGWALAYYQWQSDESFEVINQKVSITDILYMYKTMHEADISVFVEAMDGRMKETRDELRLKRLRHYANLSQRQLAEKSGVALRQIQLFEQGQRDINKAQAVTVSALAKALQVDSEALLEKNR